MNRSIKWIATSLGIVLVISVGARSLAGDPLFPDYWKASLLEAEPAPETLVVEDLESQPLQFGSVVDVLHFQVNAPGPYTLRYLTFSTDLKDLVLPEAQDWTIYEMVDDEIDYLQKVGQGESFQDGLLKVRFFSDRSHGYFGEGAQDFALVAPLKRAGEAPEIQMALPDSATLDPFFQWAWEQGHVKEAWGSF